MKKKTKKKRSPNETPVRVLGRIDETTWRRLKTAARVRGMSFTAWSIEHLDRAADEEQK